jgi:hypothetical protein
MCVFSISNSFRKCAEMRHKELGTQNSGKHDGDARNIMTSVRAT